MTTVLEVIIQSTITNNPHKITYGKLTKKHVHPLYTVLDYTGWKPINLDSKI